MTSCVKELTYICYVESINTNGNIINAEHIRCRGIPTARLNRAKQKTNNCFGYIMKVMKVKQLNLM